MARQLSEFEGCVLGHLLRHGPATAYSVRRAFLVSPSSHWSGSAGAVYPLLARLLKRRLVSSRVAPRGERNAWLYAITPSGRERFLEWLQPPFDADVVSVPPDPLRTRVHFLGVLSPRQRAEMLRQALADLRRQLETLKPSAEDNTDDRRALRGAVLAARARIQWLTGLQREITKTTRGSLALDRSRRPKAKEIDGERLRGD